jgi:hypothetical protein
MAKNRSFPGPPGLFSAKETQGAKMAEIPALSWPENNKIRKR